MFSSSLLRVTRTPASRAVVRRGMAEMPVPQSSKAVLFEGHPAKEGWESTVAWWYGTSLALLIAIYFAPETRIEVWAQEEARARLALKEKGFEDFQFGVHYASLPQDDQKKRWDKFSAKALRMTDDDDDDEEEEDEEDDE